jgi:hydroxymethylglutaryl-CoA lyase
MENLLRSFPELSIRLALATAFVCPFEGKIAPEQALPIVERAIAAGVREITLCDTVGAASPDQIHLLLEHLRAANIDAVFGLHLHDTRGLGLANTLAGLEEGVEAFETSVAGLGGCPFAPGAAGNTATEDLLNMLSAMGFSTGISFDRYMSAVQFVADNIQENITSRMHRVQGAVKQ